MRFNLGILFFKSVYQSVKKKKNPSRAPNNLDQRCKCFTSGSDGGGCKDGRLLLCRSM
jgi:hypothetical protein